MFYSLYRLRMLLFRFCGVQPIFFEARFAIVYLFIIERVTSKRNTNFLLFLSHFVPFFVEKCVYMWVCECANCVQKDVWIFIYMCTILFDLLHCAVYWTRWLEFCSHLKMTTKKEKILFYLIHNSMLWPFHSIFTEKMIYEATEKYTQCKEYNNFITQPFYNKNG